MEQLCSTMEHYVAAWSTLEHYGAAMKLFGFASNSPNCCRCDAAEVVSVVFRLLLCPPLEPIARFQPSSELSSLTMVFKAI
jgi:hypothetical protein